MQFKIIFATVFLRLVTSKSLKGTEIRAGSEYNDGLFEGDIAGVAGGRGQTRNGVLDEKRLWRYRTIYYKLSDNFSAEDRQKINEAITEYHRKTCIRLIPRPEGDNLPPWMNDYLWITNENSGCWSYIGRLGGRQQLNLQSPGCMIRGTIIHEIMHAVGFWHEQSRPDRDNYVEINKANIPEDKLSNFATYGWETVTVLDEGYDYESVMHYGAYAFAANKNIKTIIPKLASAKLGQRFDFSQTDIRKINRRYFCT